jgi:hypothetical protein
MRIIDAAKSLAFVESITAPGAIYGVFIQGFLVKIRVTVNFAVWRYKKISTGPTLHSVKGVGIKGSSILFLNRLADHRMRRAPFFDPGRTREPLF